MRCEERKGKGTQKRKEVRGQEKKGRVEESGKDKEYGSKGGEERNETS